MVVVIEKSHPNVGNTLQYNEKKMDGREGVRAMEDKMRELAEDGHVLVTRNVPEGSTIEQEIERRRENSVKKRRSGPVTKNISFHMSVNPGEKDGPISEEKAVSIIDDIMDALGYGECPYRIYKHTDIKRTHYHVVSCRLDANGKKIDDSNNYYKLQNILRRLSVKHGYDFSFDEEEEKTKEEAVAAEPDFTEPGEAAVPAAERTAGEGEENSRDEKEDSGRKAYVPSFSRKNPVPVTRQIADAHDDVVENWSFTTFEQYQALLLRRYNILAELERYSDDERLVFFGTDSKGNPITPQLYEEDLGRRDMLAGLRKTCAETRMSQKKSQRKRMDNLSKAAADKAGSFEEFRSIMERKGVYTVLSWTKDGELFGVTWIDRATKCIWKGSETDAGAKWLKETADRKGWTLTRDRYETLTDRRRNMPSRVGETIVPVQEKPAAAKDTGGKRSVLETIARTLPSGKRPLSFGHGQTIDTGDRRKKKDDIWDNEDNKEKNIDI